MRRNQFLLWGCGERSSFFVENQYFNLDCILGFIDTYKTGRFKGKKIYSPESAVQIVMEQNVQVIVTTKNENISLEIRDLMTKLFYPMDKVIFVYNAYINVREARIQNQQIESLKTDCPKLFSELKNNEDMVNQRFRFAPCQYDRFDNEKLLGKGQFGGDEFLSDYFRYRTFELVAEEIRKLGVEGAVAELGVFRGTFAKLINANFPTRKMFLFDSFSGFIPEEYASEYQKGNCDETFQSYFQQVDDTEFIEKMPYPSKCVLRKGFFPKSIQEEDRYEQFAFVSIDVDFEESTLEGLRFFYPRLAENGYIFLHDYNSYRLLGVKKAVQRYEKELGVILRKVPLSDMAGTLAIVKSVEHKTEIDDGWQNFITMKLWMDAKIDGRSFDTYFAKYDYSHVALYGAGELGKLLLKELRKTSIQVDYFIDLRAVQLREVEGVPVITIEDAVRHPVDAVIVTPLDQYERIYKNLLLIAPEMGVISLREIIYEL